MIKKLLFIILLTLSFSFSAYPADNETLKFKNIPIDGKLDTFIELLEKQGYKSYYETDFGVMLEGDFLGQDAKIAVLCSPKTKLVWKVSVIFPENKSWISLKNHYKKIKELYNKKYTYDISYEFFKDPYYEGDGYELSAFKQEKAYWTTFYMEGIMIEVNNKAELVISYENSDNGDIASQEREANSLDEI